MRRKEGDMATKLEIGDPAPQFELPKDGGGTLSLASFAGKKIVLYFYPKDDTSGCTMEAIDFNHEKFKAKHDLALTLLADESKKMLETYGVWTEKSMYGRKYMGVERTTFLIGPDGKIAHVWHKVKVPNHAEEVLAAAKAL
jgi:peroxiredoxin Q/BCP